MSFLASNAQVKDVIHSSDHQSIIWLPVNLISLQSKTTTIYGHPKLVDSKYGPVIHFDGLKDAIFLSEMPIAQLKKLTIEMIFYPDSGGNFEQRLLHFGEILSNRLLLETRSTTSGWYFDAFIYSGTQKNTLIDSTLLHPLNRWYHLAYVVDNGKLTTYVDGQKELESQINMIPLLTGKTSIGVRQNNKSWFKGSIYKIKITPKALHPKQFIKE
jgi:hypothetical protein